MEKIWVTKCLPPSIEETSELSLSALKIICYLQNSENLKFQTGLIEKNHDFGVGIINESVFEEPNKKTCSKTSIDSDHNPCHDEINSNEFLFKMAPNKGYLSCKGDISYPLQKAIISSPIVPKLNESVDMSDCSTNNDKNIDVELQLRSTEIHSSKKNIQNKKYSDEDANKNIMKNKEKITHYFPIRRKCFPTLNKQEEIYEDRFFDPNVNGILPNYDSPMKPKKLNSNYPKSNNVQTIDKYLHNQLPKKTCGSSDNNSNLKRSIKANNKKKYQSPCAINFSNFPSGTFKTIKEFPNHDLLMSFNNFFNSEINNKSNINDISKNTELDYFSAISSEKDQTTSLNKYKGNIENTRATNIFYLSKDNYENVHEIFDQTVIEIGFTLCYREGFCLLNTNFKKNDRTPNGILMYIRYSDNQDKFIFVQSDGFIEENLKLFLLRVLHSSSQKICYEAKAFILYVLENIDIGDKTVCYDWCLLDPSVAFWLLDSDHPAASFAEILQHFSFSEVQKEESCWSECCTYLRFQSLAMRYLQTELQKLKLWGVFFRLETNIIPILAVMETSSIMVNTEILKKMSTILQEKLNLLEKEAEKMVGHKFSFKSPLQISKVLFEELKLGEGNNLTIKNMKKRGNKSTSESTLKMLGNIHPLPHLILEYRQLWKLKSSYVDTILVHATKKQSVTAKWDLCATATGRIIATSPNLQAVQKKPIFLELVGKKIEFNLRSCFIARTGFTFVAADFKHIELRMFAHLAKDKTLTEWLKRENDVFNLISQARLKKDEVTSEDRNLTKTLVYALIYGAGSTKLANILSVEESIVEEIKNSLFDIFPCLWNFRENILNEVRKSKVLKSLSGRRRMFSSISSSDLALRKSAERKAINFIIQGSAADVCKLTMIAIETKLRNKGIFARLILQIHDELLWEVKNDNYHDMISVLEEVMEENKNHFLKEFQIEIPFPIVITSGNNWGNMMKIT